MPKMKTKKIVSKRFSLTKTGKLMHGVQGARHLRRKKSGSQKRRQDKPIALKSKVHTKKIKTFIAVL